jgi:hydroxyacylglutathione hydrolase
MLIIHPIPAFKDNYIWVLHNENYAVVIDPGTAHPVIDYLYHKKLQLIAILITHHHNDHTGGNIQLLNQFDVPVYGPHNESISTLTHHVKESDEVNLKELSLTLMVLETPGHTTDHIVYYGANKTKMLFCGDTLFACGCGRLFEGTAQQMYNSLQKLSNLPAETMVYSTHEYTLENIRFARTVEPGNLTLQELETTAKELRKQNTPTLPTTILKEKATNPFLRCDQPEIIRSACKHIEQDISEPISVFSTIREWKNNF